MCLWGRLCFGRRFCFGSYEVGKVANVNKMKSASTTQRLAILEHALFVPFLLNILRYGPLASVPDFGQYVNNKINERNGIRN